MFRSIYHFLLAWTGNIFYGNPSKDIFVLGVTGTKGKSTTLEMISAILEERGGKVALLSSVKRKIRDDVGRNESLNTMPGRWQLQKFLSEAVKADCDYALLEVTSEGAEQHRHKFIDWDAAMFLNLAPEHIESHGSYEEYKNAKIKFFEYLKKSDKSDKYFFVNKDDSDAQDFINVAEDVEGAEVIPFSADDIYKLAEDLRERWKKSGDVPDWIQAEFNKQNMAAAASFAKSRAVEIDVVKEAFLKFQGVEGRVEFVQKKPFGVVVDYAHTPDSLRSLYKSLKENFDYDGNLICVLGSAGGGRDKWKRPDMGEIVGNYCDKAVLTSEDPYEEDPENIVKEIEEGLSRVKSPKTQIPEYYKIVDRKEAIEKAVSMAEKNDIVAVTGMGSQPYFQGSDGKIPWDEKKVIKNALEKK